MGTDSFEPIDLFGYQLIENVFSYSECEEILSQLDQSMHQDEDQFHVRQSRGTVFAARNIMDLFPNVVNVWRKPKLVRLIHEILGPTSGLVRVLFFDKSSERSWSLPFHKDLTIAVRDNSLPSKEFSKPTHKAGVPHVEANEEILSKMLTLRIHLDEVTEENGPLQIYRGSHLHGKATTFSEGSPVKILCCSGDVLAMRPMVSHGSAHVQTEKQIHRRILHLEFSGDPLLPDNYQWHRFVPC
ncbi:MAG: phytanoyl-CoA dioxygenase family protein [Planctomycetota bacterium]